MTDAVKWEADGDDPVLPSLRSGHFEWIDLDVPAESWWEVVDHPEVLDRGLSGWNFHSCSPSPEGEDRVVLTYYRPHKLPAMHSRGPAGRLGRQVARSGRSGRGFCR
ncbi:hypothetical protein [Mycolicibacterium houstonense]|uniref:hypothetical protein n=1 Tax=Mycolicibacterium houstonense TaxID=146021 RepID=UPI00082A4729|nr:hypothetical protein [Mycolicibacterium houstonense]